MVAVADAVEVVVEAEVADAEEDVEEDVVEVVVADAEDVEDVMGEEEGVVGGVVPRLLLSLTVTPVSSSPAERRTRW